MTIHTRRREFIITFGTMTVAWPLAARAQQSTKKVPWIGWLVTGSPTTYQFSLAAFLDGLKALGYVDGRNCRIEYRWAEGNIAQLPDLANELVQQNVDVILAGGSVGAEAAKRATSVVPIVTAEVGDLVKMGLVESLAHPGGNMTGFVAAAPKTAAKRFQIMKEVEPQAERAAGLWNPRNPFQGSSGMPRRSLWPNNMIVVSLYDAHDNVEGLGEALVEISQSAPDMLVVLNDPFMFTYRKVIVEAAGRFRLPSIYGFREFVDDGGLISYGVSITGTIVARLLTWTGFSRGKNPLIFPSKAAHGV